MKHHEGRRRAVLRESPELVLPRPSVRRRALAERPPVGFGVRWVAFTPVVLPLATLVASGACEGRIGFAPQGAHGFGYDPLFLPLGFSQTLAELGETTKNRISHRSHALQALQALIPG